MAYKLPKALDEIQEAQPMPEDWYICRLRKDAYVKRNSKDTGDNMVFELVVQSDNPEYNGRTLFAYLQMPTEEDAGIFFNGQSKLDEKLQRIANFVLAFGDSAFVNEDNEVEFQQGGEAYFWVEIQDAWDDFGKKVNGISFNRVPKAIE
jgi:hypothetical protein